MCFCVGFAACVADRTLAAILAERWRPAALATGQLPPFDYPTSGIFASIVSLIDVAEVDATAAINVQPIRLRFVAPEIVGLLFATSALLHAIQL